MSYKQNGRNRKKVVYIHQFGAWWRATPNQWVRLCQAAQTPDGYDLDVLARRLQGQPQAVQGSKKEGFWGVGICVVQPLDWTNEDWERNADLNNF